VSDGEGIPCTGGGEGFEAEGGEDFCGAGVPWIRDDEGAGALVEGLKCVIFLLAGHRGSLLFRLDGLSREVDSAVAFEENERGGEEASSGEGEEDDGAAVGSLGCRRSGGSVVEALGAALRVDGRRDGENRCEERDSAEPRDSH
jgi:hypothetical protein